MMDIDSFTITSNILKILYKQECELEKSPPDCVIFHINQSNLLDIEADIIGPKATPYENGIFRVKLEIPFNFPNNPPKGYFLTKIFHPNISEKGEICVNTLKKDWNPKEWSLSNLFQVIKCLLIYPFPESALNEEAGKLFMEDYNEYSKIAKLYTNIYANNNNNNKENIKRSEIDEFKRNNNNVLNEKNSNINNFKTPVEQSRTFNLNNDNNVNQGYYQMNNIGTIRRNISISDSKDQKEIMEKWLKRI
jgi:ubiquitin-conjugating enzyme E2 S